MKVNVYGENGRHVLRQEDGAFDFHYRRIFTELMTRQRKVQFFNFDGLDDVEELYAHLRTSMLYKAPISIGLRREDVDSLFGEENPYGFEEAKQIMLRVIADGRRAYVKRVG